MSLRLSTKRLLAVLLLWASCGMTQDKSDALVVRISELRSSKYVCTVVTQEGHVRREVWSIDRGQTGRPEVFEGIASQEDMKLVRALASEPDFVTATKHNAPGMTMVFPEGRMLTVEAGSGDTPRTASFADPTGRTALPPYLAGFLSFSEDVKSRNLPKLKGKVETMCRSLSMH